MKREDDQFSTREIQGNINNKSAISAVDKINDPEEIKKRTNQALNDVEYVVFIERMVIHQQYLEFVNKQQSELSMLYENKMLYEKELQDIFNNMMLEANQTHEKLSQQQLELLNELQLKIADIMKTIDEKIQYLSSQIELHHEEIKQLDVEIDKNRKEYSDRWIARFDEALTNYETVKINLNINDELPVTLEINESIFRALAKEIGHELHHKKIPPDEINAFIELKSRELLISMLEKKFENYPLAEKERLINQALSQVEFQQGVKTIHAHVVNHALQDSKIKDGLSKGVEHIKRKEVIDFKIENNRLEINSFEKIQETLSGSFKNMEVKNASNTSSAKQFTSESAASKVLSIISKAERSVAQVSNMAELKVRTAEAQLQQVTQKLDAAEASAKIQLSNGKADQFDPNDFLSALSDDKNRFLSSLKKLDSPASSAKFGAKTSKTMQEEETVNFRPNR